MSNPQNLMVNVSCPHCSKPLLVAISGFAGELASRTKVCKFCEREYHVHILSSTSVVDSPSDGQIRELKSRISYLKEQRKITAAELLVKREFYQRLNDEVMELARKQRSNFELN